MHHTLPTQQNHEQIWKNAQKFNHDGSPLWSAAEHLRHQLERLYKVFGTPGWRRHRFARDYVFRILVEGIQVHVLVL